MQCRPSLGMSCNQVALNRYWETCSPSCPQPPDEAINTIEESHARSYILQPEILTE